MIQPHGGKLINLMVDGVERDNLLHESESMPEIIVDEYNMADLEMLSSGALSPLTGFMNSKDYNSVVDNIRLADGTVWPVPIVLAVNDSVASKIEDGSRVVLKDDNGTVLAVLNLEEKFNRDKEREKAKIFKGDDKHPGVIAVQEGGNICLAGKIQMLNKIQHDEFHKYRLEPEETRAYFEKMGWNRIVAFQTRNPIHRAHEYLTKSALNIVDGLMIHPLMGKTKEGDISGEVRMKCYTTLIDNYYPNNRVLLGIFPAWMRYAGPREAIFHALVRKNYGCTHFIVGRDHAGVGDYYGTYDAQYIFDEFDIPNEIGIEPLMFEHCMWSKKAGEMVSLKTCPNPDDKDDFIFLSGTKVREMLQNGEVPPEEFTRPEVAKILISSMKK